MASKPRSIIEHPLDETLESIEQRILESLRPMFDAQRDATRAAIDEALAGRETTNWIDLASDLHALAGTAAHFGQEGLGDCARKAEGAIRHAEPRNRRLDALRDVREAIERAG